MLTNTGVVGADCGVAIGSARKSGWLVPRDASAFTGRTNAGQCPKLANANSTT